MQAQQDRLQQAETSLKRRLNEEENAAKKAHSWKTKVGTGVDVINQGRTIRKVTGWGEGCRKKEIVPCKVYKFFF